MAGFEGCPGSRMMHFNAQKADTSEQAVGQISSQLRQWPIQMHLISPTAPYYQNADVLLTADCVAYALGDFHREYLKDKSLAIACPKLDDTSPYVEKLAAMLKQNDIRSVTVTIMEVPCCRGMAMFAQQAIAQSGKNVPLEIAVIGIDGTRKA